MIKPLHKLCSICAFAAAVALPLSLAHAQTTTTITTTTTMTSGGITATNLDDAQILGILNVVNDNEINASKTAMAKNLPADIGNFANMMIQEHQSNHDQTRTLASSIGVAPNEERDAQMLRQKGQTALQQMQSLSGDAFAKAYVAEMVQDHTDALNMLNNQLIPNAKNAQLKDHLTRTKDAVSKHLEEANQLMSKWR